VAHGSKVRMNFMHLALVTAFAFGYSANTVLGQTLIGLTVLPGDTTVTIVSINPVTGAQTPLMATPSIGVSGLSLAVDPASQRVFFVGDEPTPDPGFVKWFFYVADLRHRTISATPQTADTGGVGQMFWDPVGNQLIGLAYLPGGHTMTVSAVDPATAALTPLVPTSFASENAQVAFDPVGRRIFFGIGSQNGPPYGLTMVDLANRTISQPVPFPCCPSLFWDPQRGLLGFNFLNNSLPWMVVSVDPSTGLQTPLLPTPAGGAAGGYVTLDPATGRVFFADPFAQTLFTANLQSGNVSQSPQLAACCPALVWLPAASVTVPALNAGGLAILSLALALLGWSLATRTPTR
jgi:hypothetical protein